MHIDFEITIAFCACFLQRSEPALTVRATAQSVTAPLGDYVNVAVQIDPTDGVEGYWTKLDLSGNEIRINGDNVKYISDPATIEDLMIMNADVTDTGLYVFHATNGAESAQNDPIPVYIEGAPLVRTSMSSETVSLNSTFTLNCSCGSSSSIVDVNWLNIDINGTSSFINETNTMKYSGSKPNQPSLTIMNVENGDLGKYWCYAKDSKDKIGISSQITLSLTAGTAVSNFADSTTSTNSLTIPSTSVTYSTATYGSPVRSGNQATTTYSTSQITSKTSAQGQTTTTAAVSQETAVSNISNGTASTNSWTNPTTSVTYSTATSGILVTTANQATSFATTTYSTSQTTSTTNAQDQTTSTTAVSQGNLLCPCDCEFKARIDYWASLNLKNYTLEELRIILQPELIKLEERLRVNKTNLSSTIRKLTSAKDNRPVAKGIGTVGIVFIIFLIACILIADLTSLQQHISNIKRIWNIKPAAKTTNID